MEENFDIRADIIRMYHLKETLRKTNDEINELTAILISHSKEEEFVTSIRDYEEGSRKEVVCYLKPNGRTEFVEVPEERYDP